jgi:hypothetical protein
MFDHDVSASSVTPICTKETKRPQAQAEDMAAPPERIQEIAVADRQTHEGLI